MSSEPQAVRMRDVVVKGSFLRGYSGALERNGLLGLVRERASPRLREALELPPPTSSWVDYGLCEEILRLVEAARGLIGVRKLGHDVVAASVAPSMQIVVNGLLRLFGTSPGTLFGFMSKAAGQTIRGIEYGYEARSTASGVMTVTFPQRQSVEAAVWHSTAGGLEVVFETCGVVGHVQDPVAEGNGAQFRVSWQR
jgi:hypothetical protein